MTNKKTRSSFLDAQASENLVSHEDKLKGILDLLRKSRMTAVFYFLFLAFFSTQTFAAKQIQEVNYFASLRSNETNVRAGPGQNYPIKFSFKMRAVPVRVISEYDNWNEIEDFEGQSGWVMQSLLTKKRTLMVRTSKSAVDMRSKNSEKSRLIFHLENNVIGDYMKCEENWCGIKVDGKKGWVQKADVFGADE